MLKIAFLSISLVLTSAAGLLADQNSDFEAAVDLWLEGNDETSLPILAELAIDGHVNARIFLPQIERSSSLTSDYVTSLTRKDRNALFRAPSGLSGTSWLKVESPNSELAAALYIAGKGNVATAAERLDSAIYLLENGERMRGISTFATMIRANEFRFLHDQENLPTEFTMVIDAMNEMFALNPSSAQYDDNMRALETSVRARFGSNWELISLFFYDDLDIPQNEFNNLRRGTVLDRHVSSNIVSSESQQTYENWLLQSPEFGTVNQVCAHACPEETGACARVLYWMLRGDNNLTLTSPAETFVSLHRYQNSERAVRDTVSRWVNHFRSFDTPMPQDSACFAELAEVEIALRE